MISLRYLLASDDERLMQPAWFHAFGITDTQIAYEGEIVLLVPLHSVILACAIALPALCTCISVVDDVSVAGVDAQGTVDAGFDAGTLIALTTLMYFDF
jgi:hypothetical protein